MKKLKLFPMLRQFPLTYAFVAYVAADTKGGDIEYWMNELKSYQITSVCKCNQCYSFCTQSDDDFGPFDQGGACMFYSEFIAIMHHNEDGTMSEFELPTRDDIPFSDEYGHFSDCSYESTITLEDAAAKVMLWMECV